MNKYDFDNTGDLHKSYESRNISEVMPGIPVVIRLDGRAFHTFTKGIEKPYEARMSNAMKETTKYLIENTQANVGYTQSDEITLAFKNDKVEVPFMYSGRVQKLCSIVASMATAKFNQVIAQTMPERANMLPVFDARVFQYPNLDLCSQTFMWREEDATRNSLSMAAQTYYSSKELYGAGFSKKHDMLHAKGINWNNYPAFFKRGSYFAKRTVMKELSEYELQRIKEEFRPTGKVQRSLVIDLELPPYTQITNFVDVLFNSADFEIQNK